MCNSYSGLLKKPRNGEKRPAINRTLWTLLLRKYRCLSPHFLWRIKAHRYCWAVRYNPTSTPNGHEVCLSFKYTYFVYLSTSSLGILILKKSATLISFSGVVFLMNSITRFRMFFNCFCSVFMHPPYKTKERYTGCPSWVIRSPPPPSSVLNNRVVILPIESTSLSSLKLILSIIGAILILMLSIN